MSVSAHSFNLLPWRKAYNTRRNRQFYLWLVISLSFALMTWLIFTITPIKTLLKQQAEVGKLQEQIKAIDQAYQQTQYSIQQQQQQIQLAELLKRKLQDDALLLQLLHNLREKMPADIYLTAIHKTDKGLYLIGKSPSHTEVTLLLKNLEGQVEYGRPQLTETKHSNKKDPEIDFELVYNER